MHPQEIRAARQRGSAFRRDRTPLGGTTDRSTWQQTRLIDIDAQCLIAPSVADVVHGESDAKHHLTRWIPPLNPDRKCPILRSPSSTGSFVTNPPASTRLRIFISSARHAVPSHRQAVAAIRPRARSRGKNAARRRRVFPRIVDVRRRDHRANLEVREDAVAWYTPRLPTPARMTVFVVGRVGAHSRCKRIFRVEHHVLVVVANARVHGWLTGGLPLVGDEEVGAPVAHLP